MHVNGALMRTNLEQYLAVTVQMLMARDDGRDEDPYLDKLDNLHKLLTVEEIKFVNEMGQDWCTQYWCSACSTIHPKSFKCSKAEPNACEGCGKPSSYVLCQSCFESGEFQ